MSPKIPHGTVDEAFLESRPLFAYGLLIATPITAIVGAWLEGHPITLLAFGNIGPMLSQAHDIGQSLASNSYYPG